MHFRKRYAHLSSGKQLREVGDNIIGVAQGVGCAVRASRAGS